MLSKIKMRAVNMLFTSTDDEICALLKIKKETLSMWKEQPEFIDMLDKRLQENLIVSKRILSQIYVDSCRELGMLINSDANKDKPRVIIEVLKASGLFKDLNAGNTEKIQDLIRGLSNEKDETEFDEKA